MSGQDNALQGSVRKLTTSVFLPFFLQRLEAKRIEHERQRELQKRAFEEQVRSSPISAPLPSFSSFVALPPYRPD